MKLGRTIAAALTASSLVAAPIAAQAAPAHRAADNVQGENLRGGFIIPLVAVVAIILGILAATSMHDDHGLPHSP
jgi:hypothetical protein